MFQAHHVSNTGTIESRSATCNYVSYGICQGLFSKNAHYLLWTRATEQGPRRRTGTRAAERGREAANVSHELLVRARVARVSRRGRTPWNAHARCNKLERIPGPVNPQLLHG